MAFSVENHLPGLFDIDPADVSMTLLDSGIAPANIIHAGDTIELQIDWIATGNPFFLALLPPTTAFVPVVFFDRRGGGGADPATITGAAVPLVAAASNNYSTTIDLSPSLNTAGAYELTIAMRMVDVPGAPTFVFWHGMDEIPLVHVEA